MLWDLVIFPIGKKIKCFFMKCVFYLFTLLSPTTTLLHCEIHFLNRLNQWESAAARLLRLHLWINDKRIPLL